MTDAPDDTAIADLLKDALSIFDLCSWVEEQTGRFPLDAELYSWRTLGDARRWIERQRVTV